MTQLLDRQSSLGSVEVHLAAWGRAVRREPRTLPGLQLIRDEICAGKTLTPCRRGRRCWHADRGAWPTGPKPPRPWPDAPRPYPEEPLGGWVGRIVYRYRIPAADLLDRTGLPGQALSASGWWLLPVLPQTQIARLAEAARLPPGVLEALQTPEAWFMPRSRNNYCGRPLRQVGAGVLRALSVHESRQRLPSPMDARVVRSDLGDRCSDCSRVHAWIRTADLRRCLHRANFCQDRCRSDRTEQTEGR